MAEKHNHQEAMDLRQRRTLDPTHPEAECGCNMCIGIESLFMAAAQMEGDGDDPHARRFSEALTRWIWGYSDDVGSG